MHFNLRQMPPGRHAEPRTRLSGRLRWLPPAPMVAQAEVAKSNHPRDDAARRQSNER